MGLREDTVLIIYCWVSSASCLERARLFLGMGVWDFHPCGITVLIVLANESLVCKGLLELHRSSEGCCTHCKHDSVWKRTVCTLQTQEALQLPCRSKAAGHMCRNSNTSHAGAGSPSESHLLALKNKTKQNKVVFICLIGKKTWKLARLAGNQPGSNPSQYIL